MRFTTVSQSNQARVRSSAPDESRTRRSGSAMSRIIASAIAAESFGGQASTWPSLMIASSVSGPTVVSVANERHDDGVAVKLTFEGGRPVAFTVPGHDSRLGQVIDNLIDNAFKYGRPPVRIKVTGAPATSGSPSSTPVEGWQRRIARRSSTDSSGSTR